MKTKPKICEKCKADNKPRWSAKFKCCKTCFFKYFNKPTAKAPPKKNISKVGSKLLAELAVYRKKRIKFLTENPLCQGNLKGCTFESTDLHHAKGRGKYLNVENYFRALCRNCHDYIELHPDEAKELKLSINRLTDESE